MKVNSSLQCFQISLFLFPEKHEMNVHIWIHISFFNKKKKAFNRGYTVLGELYLLWFNMVPTHESYSPSAYTKNIFSFWFDSVLCGPLHMGISVFSMTMPVLQIELNPTYLKKIITQRVIIGIVCHLRCPVNSLIDVFCNGNLWKICSKADLFIYLFAYLENRLSFHIVTCSQVKSPYYSAKPLCCSDLFLNSTLNSVVCAASSKAYLPGWVRQQLFLVIVAFPTYSWRLYITKPTLPLTSMQALKSSFSVNIRKHTVLITAVKCS